MITLASSETLSTGTRIRSSFQSAIFVAIIISVAAATSATAQCVIRTHAESQFSAFEFGRIVDTRFANDTTFVVADGQSREVHLFTTSGRLLAKTGRRGSGPGEFRAVDIVTQYGSLIGVYDGILRRLVTYDAGLKLVDTQNPEIGAGRFFGISQRGTAVATDPHVVGNRGDNGPEPYTDTTIVRIREAGKSWRVIDRSIGQAKMFNARGVFGIVPAPFSERPQIRVNADIIVVGDRSAAIRRFDDRGRRLSPIKLPWKSSPISSEDLARWSAHYVSSRPDRDRPLVRAMLADAPRQSHSPAHGAIAIDRTGQIWVQEYRAPYERSPTDVILFDRNATVRGSGRLPADHTIVAASPTALLTVAVDELDVQTLHIHPITCS